MTRKRKCAILAAVLMTASAFCGMGGVEPASAAIIGEVSTSNTINGTNSTVSGGRNNTASGNYSSVSGGGGENSSSGPTEETGEDGTTTTTTTTTTNGNTASGDYSTVSGGSGNTASGNAAQGTPGTSSYVAESTGSSVSGGGGAHTTTHTTTTSTSTGTDDDGSATTINTTTTTTTTTTKGNTASGDHSSVSGGSGNRATGANSSVSGGGGTNTTTDTTTTVTTTHADGTTTERNYSRNSTTYYGNEASGDHSSVTGGSGNRATGAYSSITGGGGSWYIGQHTDAQGWTYHDGSNSGGNVASGAYSSITAGSEGEASGNYSSISGGFSMSASGLYSSASGGIDSSASGNYSSVSGGYHNGANGYASSVSGGEQNTAGAGHNFDSVSGGHNNLAGGGWSSISGGAYNQARGLSSSISGGDHNVAGPGSGNYTYSMVASSVSGGRYNWAAGNYSLAAGGQGSQIGGNYSVGIAGGSTAREITDFLSGTVTQHGADNAVAIGSGSYVAVSNGMAIGNGSVATEANNTISFGHNAGDSYIAHSTNDTASYLDDYTLSTYDTAAYNILSNVGYGRGATTANPSYGHDAATMDQLTTVASSDGSVTVTDTTWNNSNTNSTDTPRRHTYNLTVAHPLHYYSVNSADTTAGSNYNDDGATGTNAIAVGVGASSTRESAVAVGTSASAGGTNAVAIGANANATVDGGAAIGSGSVANRAAGTTSGSEISGYDPATGTASTLTDSTWRSTAGAVSVGSNVEGSVVTRQITNVAAGSADTDAVNVAQLKNVAVSISDEAGKHSTVSAGKNITVTASTPAGQGTDYRVAVNDDIDVNSVTTNNLNVHDSARVGDVTINNNGGGTVNNLTNTTWDANNITHGQAATEDQLRTVSQDVTAVDNRVTNLAGDVNHLNSRVSRLSTRVNKVGAGAAALAALHPLDFDPDSKWDFAAGYGNYRDANAVAVGAFYRPNEDTMFSVGTSFGNGENMVNAGVSLKIGSGNHISTSRVAMARDILALKQQVETLTRKLAVYESGGKVSPAGEKKDVNFPDVPENHWAYQYVKTLADRGYLEGYPDGEFKGDRALTRYEYAAIIYRALQNGAPSDGDMARSVDEFGPELEKVQAIDRFRVDRIAGKDNDRHKIERVRVNNKSNKAAGDYRDVYGSHIPNPNQK